MDIKAEKHFKEAVKTDISQFIPLYDEFFPALYRYVSRRISDPTQVQTVVEIVLMDVFGQVAAVPQDVSFSTWLYRLAWERLQPYFKKNISGGPDIKSPIFDGASVIDGVYDDEYKLKQQAETFFAGLILKEREIVKLKFFEEITDGEVKYVLDVEESIIGPVIYQVLKKGYQILFGSAVGAGAGVYFGELHSFLARLKVIEKIAIDEDFKLKLKLKINEKIEKMTMEKYGNNSGLDSSGPARAGLSDDPAKIFVQAAKGMSREEVDKITEEYVRSRSNKKENLPTENDFSSEIPIDKVSVDTAYPSHFEGVEAAAGNFDTDDLIGERMISIQDEISEKVPVNFSESDDDYYGDTAADKFYGFIDRWRWALSVVSTFVFVVAAISVLVFMWMGRVTNEGITGLPFDISYEDGFAEQAKDPKEIADYDMRIKIENEIISKIASGKIVDHVEAHFNKELSPAVLTVDFKMTDDGWLEYKFDAKIKENSDGTVNVDYKVRSYEKIEN